jgi:ribose/xylose/arabinose/galactoside ABC-type transport system permease subunit
MATKTASEPTSLPEASARRGRLGSLSIPREVGLLILIVIIIIVCSLAFPQSFPQYANFAAILRNLAFDGIMAIGMMMLLVGGSFDLSVGSMFSMIGVIVGALMVKNQVHVALAILLGLLIAALGGFINGFVIAKVRVNALITTLGTLGIFRGVAVLVGGPGITNLPEGFSNLGQFEFPELIQSPVWLMLILAIVFHYLLGHTRFFRQYYYIGSNPKAASLSGINVQRMQIVGYTIMGLLAGLAGMAFASRVGTSVSIAGDGAELRVITAVILGGASLQGGKGNIIGALIGVFFIALISNVMIIARVDSYWQSIVVGAVLVAAVAMDSILNRE